MDIIGGHSGEAEAGDSTAVHEEMTKEDVMDSTQVMDTSEVMDSTQVMDTLQK